MKPAFAAIDSFLNSTTLGVASLIFDRFDSKLGAPRHERLQMAADYDAPKKTDDDAESLDAIKQNTKPTSPSIIDVEEDGIADDHEREQLIDEALEVTVIPPQTDEFTCSECFIVKHKSMMSTKKSKYGPVCNDCA
ncbi:MAG: hypothetical protein RLZZ164_1081 [Actinomycetota bacterium]